jgi:Kef-type K+ transport system membrane component KefB/Trk K+ transport system NAD-binding subunit
MEESHSFVPLLIVALLAFLVPLALSRFKRLRVPVVVGEILVGIIIGDSGLQLVGHDPMLEILALLGFAYLMFLSGLEVDFGAILPKPGLWRGSRREQLANPLTLGVLTFIVTLGLALLAGWGLNTLDAADDPWLAALILSTTSLGLVMPVLKERGLTSKPYGQALLVAAVVADFATMLLVSIYVVLRTEGLSLNVLLVLLLFGAFATAYRVANLARRHFPGLNRLQGLSQATSQVDVRGAFALALAFIALAQGLGVEMILGAFLGGALVGLLAGNGAMELRHKLDLFGYAFFIPIFFIMIGVRFDLSALLSSTQALLLVPVILFLAYAIKFAASLLFRVGFSWRETLAGGALLSSRLSLIIAVSAIGLQMGSIDSATNSAIILVAIVTSTLSPLLFSRIAPAAETVQRKFVIAGAGRSARLLAKRILEHGYQVILVAQDPRHLETAREMDLSVVEADAAQPETWDALKPETIRAVAVLLAEDERNLEVSRVVRDIAGVKRVVSRAHEASHTPLFVEMGVQMINPTMSPVVELEYLLLFPSVTSLMTDLDDEHDITELRLTCPELTEVPLQDLDLPEEAMIVLIRRDGDVIYPRGHTRLQMGDRLTLMGPLEAVQELARRCR